jgi:Holliday junction resolvase RusA-like endonuclease
MNKCFQLDLPPSSNNIYYNIKGGRALTSEARSWKRRAVHSMVEQGNLCLDTSFEPDSKYGIELYFFFKAVENEGWYKRDKNGNRKAKSRWKKIDLSNRIKLLEDALKDATGVDDSAIFEMIIYKKQSDKPMVMIEIYEAPEP